ncbi:SDR family NAD(P)-dependent oxidoreductase [Actinacidiphila yeochonensis]|uniref:SDR family NAD(P)-dependent oxidoreductase n=1 Tax=Actinacidiphila yeochonensis TaxID=89050 RepID=UPI0006922739|nr:SDR family NAD(P)-dependent oxidoreductase [Actinacidiphila yeochonensis]
MSRAWRAGAARHRGWAVVTGASSGIGREMAGRLAARGHRLLLVARRKDRLDELAGQLRGAYRARVEVRACDLADRADRAELVEELAALEIGVLANNAGFTTCGYLADGDPRAEAAEVEVDVVAMHELTLAVLPGMLARRCGSILITGSTAGMQPVPGAATYAASKAFVNTFAESLHAELRGTGVSCTLLAPGPVRTEFMAVGGAAELEAKQWMAWKTPRTVARAGLRAARRGRRIAVPGVVAKAQALAGRHVPHRVTFVVVRRLVLPRLRRPAAAAAADPRERPALERAGRS